MGVCDSDNNNRVAFDGVEQRVRKVREKTAPDARLDFQRG